MASQPPRPQWAPFVIDNSRLFAPRSIHTLEGVGDRLRTAAFAEVQAELAFAWAAEVFEDAPGELRQAWRELAREEAKHRDWLLGRMRELGIGVEARPVSDVLWDSLTSRVTAQDFCQYMARAEERGRQAGVRFYETLLAHDPVTARIFGQIAEEEQAHIELAQRFFPTEPRT